MHVTAFIKPTRPTIYFYFGVFPSVIVSIFFTFNFYVTYISLGITSRRAVAAFTALYTAWSSVRRLPLLSSSRLMESSRIILSYPLCEESKHLPMPSGVKGPSHKALNLSLSSQNLGHTNKACPTSSSVSGHVGHSALSYTPILFR